MQQASKKQKIEATCKEISSELEVVESDIDRIYEELKHAQDLCVKASERKYELEKRHLQLQRDRDINMWTLQVYGGKGISLREVGKYASFEEACEEVDLFALKAQRLKHEWQDHMFKILKEKFSFDFKYKLNEEKILFFLSHLCVKIRHVQKVFTVGCKLRDLCDRLCQILEINDITESVDDDFKELCSAYNSSFDENKETKSKYVYIPDELVNIGCMFPIKMNVSRICRTNVDFFPIQRFATDIPETSLDFFFVDDYYTRTTIRNIIKWRETRICKSLILCQWNRKESNIWKMLPMETIQFIFSFLTLSEIQKSYFSE